MTPDKVKAKIQELCPDVMELKFGCKVSGYAPEYVESYEGPRSPAIRAVGIVTNSPYLQIDDAFGDVLIEDLKNGVVSEEDDAEFEILGSPITLAVVLRAINKIHNAAFYARADGVLFKWEKFTEGGDGHHGVESTYIEWNLEHDNYDQQSDECKQFIGSLIGV